MEEDYYSEDDLYSSTFKQMVSSFSEESIEIEPQSTQNIQRANKTVPASTKKKVLKHRDLPKFSWKPKVVEAVIAEWENPSTPHTHTIILKRKRKKALDSINKGP